GHGGREPAGRARRGAGHAARSPRGRDRRRLDDRGRRRRGRGPDPDRLPRGACRSPGALAAAVAHVLGWSDVAARRRTRRGGGGPDPEQVATKLAAMRVVRLDAMVATHPHLDHYEGLAAVLARIPTGVVLDSGCRPAESRSPPYLAFLRAVREAGVPERHPVAGDVFVVGDVRIDILSPDRCWQGTNSDPNNDSLVL